MVSYEYKEGEKMIKMRLKEVLDNKGISVTELHERTGISKNTISLMVNNKSKGIQYDTLNKILKATNVNLSDLLEEVTDTYCMFVKGVNNDYTPLNNHESRTFHYQIWVDLENGEEELVYDFSFTVLFFKVQDRTNRSYLHISFDDYNPQNTNLELANKFNPNMNKTALNVMAYLIVTDLLWNMDFPYEEVPSLAYFNWYGFERDSVHGLSINVPISYPDLENINWKNFKKAVKNNDKKTADFQYLKFTCSDVEEYIFDKETGETAIFFHFS